MSTYSSYNSYSYYEVKRKPCLEAKLTQQGWQNGKNE